MNISQFFNKWLGKENDNGSVKDACVNLIHSFHEEVLGIPRFVGNAIDYKPTQLTKVSNIMPNDVVVFNYGKDGHIGLCVWSRDKDFECMEQNNPIGSPCHYVYHTDFNKVVSIWRPNLPEAPRPQLNHIGQADNMVFTMSYTCFNADPNLMQQARNLMQSFTGGKIDATFEYHQTNLNSLTQDEQPPFLVWNGVKTPFVFAFYHSSNPGYFQMQTATVIGSSVVLTAATDTSKDPLYTCYEFCNALYAHFKQPGNDIYTPSEDFVKAKFQAILPFVNK